MKILSFDVGIKNLAYCLINKIDDNFKIEDWGIINLDDQRKKCTCITNRKKECGQTALYSYFKDNKQEYYCKKHKKLYEIPEIKTINSNVGDKCNYKNKKGELCNKKAFGMLDKKEEHEAMPLLTLCNAHLKIAVHAKLKELGPTKLQNQNCNKIAIQTLATKLFKYLDEKKNFLAVTEILIENQPSLKNPTMKTISSLLFGYFCMRGIVDKNKINNESKVEMVKFFSPSNKLKINKDQSDKLLKKGENERQIYDITKNLGEAYCKALINDDSEKLKFINDQKKKDDLCDAFLQGFFHLFYKNNIALPTKYKLILEKVAKDIDNLEKLKQNNKKQKTDNTLLPKKGKKIIIKGKKPKNNNTDEAIILSSSFGKNKSLTTNENLVNDTLNLENK